MPPIERHDHWASGEAANSGVQRATMYTPAVTIVAAWIRALTGVGPSIASGSQTCSGNWPLLPHAPSKSNRQIAVATPAADVKPRCASAPGRRCQRRVSWKSSVP